MKTIIVATDFSPAALNAAGYAADMALSIGAGLLLFHACQMPVVYSEIPVSMNLEEEMESAEKQLSELKKLLAKSRSKSLVIDTKVKVGEFYAQLNALCKEIKPYVVIMGCQGKTTSERFLFGGHAVYAMKHLEWPLITVPANSEFSSIKKIGLACDLENVAEIVPVEEIKILLNDFNAALHIVNTGHNKDYDPEVVFGSGLLQEMLYNVNPTFHMITHKDIDTGILEFAEKNHVDLLIVLPKRYGLLESIIHRSHTKQFVLHSHVPVMSLHQ